MARIARAIAALALLAAVVTPAAHASRGQESLFQDDASLLQSGEAKREQTLDELRDLGVDVIRVNVLWTRYAPRVKSARRPRFDAADPNAYPLGELDALVGGAAARGMSVLFTVTGPAPAWASRCGGPYRSRRHCDPDPAEYGQWVTALGRRFPNVTRWSFWNEPNLASRLRPQWRKRGRRYIPWSPHMYRGLVRAGTAALAGTGHGDDEILLGETARGGMRTGRYRVRSLAPVPFYRELLCLDGRGRRLRGNAARIRGCGGYTRLAVTGAAHHPYSRGAGESPRARPGKHDITLSTMSRLGAWLDRGARNGRVPARLPMWITEFGVQTNPPDRFAGTSLANQARWLNQSDWMAWRNPRIRSMAQYELFDERALGAFQTGLRFVSGRAKPALAAYRLPIWAVATRHWTKLWIHVRPQVRMEDRQTVTIQYRGRKGPWRTLGRETVRGPRGFLYMKARRHAPLWRFVWDGRTSRATRPASR